MQIKENFSVMADTSIANLSHRPVFILGSVAFIAGAIIMICLR